MDAKTITRPLTNREYYAQKGVNYDKSTRRFLAAYPDDEQTVRLTADEVQRLVTASASEVEP